MLASISCVMYLYTLFVSVHIHVPYVVLLLCSGDDLHSLEGSGSGGDQNRNAIGRTTSRPGARRVLQTFYVPLECFNCVQRPASSVQRQRQLQLQFASASQSRRSVQFARVQYTTTFLFLVIAMKVFPS